MEPIDRTDNASNSQGQDTCAPRILRPRLSVKEAGVIAVTLEDFVKSHEGLKNDVAVVYAKELAKRFSHLAEGSKFLRPRRKKGR